MHMAADDPLDLRVRRDDLPEAIEAAKSAAIDFREAGREGRMMQGQQRRPRRRFGQTRRQPRQPFVAELAAAAAGDDAVEGDDADRPDLLDGVVEEGTFARHPRRIRIGGPHRLPAVVIAGDGVEWRL